jgi:hypothetical protein
MASRWTYSNWITLDGADRLTRLRLHIQEVSDYTQGTSTRGQSVTSVDPQYLANLMREEKDLAARLVGDGSGGGFARSQIKFTRD